jgi:uncharacterized protein (TIGR02594 family)
MTKWMETAWSQVGVMETAGAEASPQIVGYFREVGHPEAASDEIAWCAAFVGACLERSGIASTKSLAARSYATFGTDTDPRIGAIAVFSRGSDPVHGHVGFVVGITDTSIMLLGGNQSNKVSVTTMPRDRLIACRWPEAKPPGAASIEHAVDRATNSLSVRGFIGAGLAGIASLWSPALDALSKAASEATGVYSHLSALHLGTGRIAAGVGIACLGVAFVRQFLPRSTP